MGLDCSSQSDTNSVRAAIVLATYAQAAEVLAAGIEWWRVVCDEPHAALTAAPRAGRIDTSPALPACAAILSGLRWCLTGTPFTNSLFDVFGQLTFLGLIGANDTGRHGIVGVLPALHFRNHIDGGGRWQSEHNDSADVAVSLLKPLMARHTKAQTRHGQVLLALQPCTYHDVLVELLAQLGSKPRPSFHSTLSRMSSWIVTPRPAHQARYSA